MSSITDLVSQTAAKNPVVGVAVAMAATKTAILAGIATSDSGLGGLLGAVSNQAVETNQLLASLNPNLGSAVDTHA